MPRLFTFSPLVNLGQGDASCIHWKLKRRLKKKKHCKQKIKNFFSITFLSSLSSSAKVTPAVATQLSQHSRTFQRGQSAVHTAFAFTLGRLLLSSRRLAANKLFPRFSSIDLLILAFALIIQGPGVGRVGDRWFKLRTGSGVWLRLDSVLDRMPLVKVQHHTEAERRWTRSYVGLAWLAELGNGVIQTITGFGQLFDESSYSYVLLPREMSKY